VQFGEHIIFLAYIQKVEHLFKDIITKIVNLERKNKVEERVRDYDNDEEEEEDDGDDNGW
jgi:aspartate 1-decarboxylase